jgi:hypothetical protein
METPKKLIPSIECMYYRTDKPIHSLKMIQCMSVQIFNTVFNHLCFKNRTMHLLHNEI